MKPSEQLTMLESLQFNVVLNGVEKTLTNDLLSARLVEGRTQYQYEMDGIVVYHDKIYDRSSGNPDHAFAFKMVLSEQMAEAKGAGWMCHPLLPTQSARSPPCHRMPCRHHRCHRRLDHQGRWTSI